MFSFDADVRITRHVACHMPTYLFHAIDSKVHLRRQLPLRDHPIELPAGRSSGLREIDGADRMKMKSCSGGGRIEPRTTYRRRSQFVQGKIYSVNVTYVDREDLVEDEGKGECFISIYICS